jgi:hypothetical protein
MSQTLADTPKAALEDFLNELSDVYYPWYDKSVLRHYRIWLPVQFVTLGSVFASSIIAALLTDEAFKGLSAGRIALVVLPAIGGAAATIATQSRLYDRYQLREAGRLGIQNLVNVGRARFASAKDDADYAAIHNELIRDLEAIEAAQGQGFFSFGTK